jgi:hypothetical protein
MSPHDDCLCVNFLYCLFWLTSDALSLQPAKQASPVKSEGVSALRSAPGRSRGSTIPGAGSGAELSLGTFSLNREHVPSIPADT